jgi:hypothetical protein
MKPRLGCYAPSALSNSSMGKANANTNEALANEVFTLVPLLTAPYFYAAFDAQSLRGLSRDLIKGIAVYVTREIELSSGAFKEPVPSITFKECAALNDGFGAMANMLTDQDKEVTPSPSFINFVYTYPSSSLNAEQAYSELSDPVSFYRLALIPYSFLEEHDFKVFATVGNGCFRSIDDAQNWASGEFTDKDREANNYEGAGYAMFEVERTRWENITSQPSLPQSMKSQKGMTVVDANSTYDYNSRLIYGGFVQRMNTSFSVSSFLGDSRLPGMRNGRDMTLYLRGEDTAKTIAAKNGYLRGYKGETIAVFSPYSELKGIAYEAGNIGTAGFDDLSSESVAGYSRYLNVSASSLRDADDLKDMFVFTTSDTVPPEWKTDNMHTDLSKARKPNSVAVTKVANPWVIEAVYELACGEILALSSATEALSEGQFGEFPVYAFTDNGIYALSVSDTGAIAAKQPISREVLSAPNAVLQLDNAVVFPTKAGLRHLSGRTVTPLSDTINGFNINEALYDTPPELTIADRQPFNEQIQNCRMLYDPANRLIHIFNDLEGDEAAPAAVQHRWAESLEPVPIDNGWYMRSDLSRIEIPGGTRQKHYVLDIPSGQWATQILPQKLTACVPGYPFSTMQFGRSLMQYTSELEKDTLRPGWLITRPVAFGDLFARKMLADIRAFGQKTSAGTAFRIRVYTSDDRTHWHPLSSLKSRSAKWYRFLVKADMTGLDTLSGLACQYVQRLGQKLR